MVVWICLPCLKRGVAGRKRYRVQAVGKNLDPDERPLFIPRLVRTDPSGEQTMKVVRSAIAVRVENDRGCRRDTIKASEFFGKVSALVVMEPKGGIRIPSDRGKASGGRSLKRSTLEYPIRISESAHAFKASRNHSPARKCTRQSVMNATSTERWDVQKTQPLPPTTTAWAPFHYFY